MAKQLGRFWGIVRGLVYRAIGIRRPPPAAGRRLPQCPECMGYGTGIFIRFCNCGCGLFDVKRFCPTCAGAGRVTAALVRDYRKRGDAALADYAAAASRN
jgi:hypothetical protein